MKRHRPFITALILLIVGCQGPNPRVVTALNIPAALSGDIPIDPLGWAVITSSLNQADATMSTLFGNERAIAHARTQGGSEYPPGAILSLVTWRQQEDARWFGANIPAQPKSVEFVSAVLSSGGRITYVYRNFAGSPLRECSAVHSRVAERTAWLLSQPAAVMP